LTKISAIFWDIGGVLLTNAWDGSQRASALTKFNLDPVEFGDRHEMVVSSWERGKISFDEYLDRTVFYRERGFRRETFKDYIYSLSQPHGEALEIARALARSGRYLMGTINNESRDLNAYRITTFGLQEIFTLFVSSCYVGFRKPEEAIYRMALEIAQRTPEECCFVDDRALNIETAQVLGMHGIRMSDPTQLRDQLKELGVEV
jgi:putative hydrolase of the HAD superfamily